MLLTTLHILSSLHKYFIVYCTVLTFFIKQLILWLQATLLSVFRVFRTEFNWLKVLQWKILNIDCCLILVIIENIPTIALNKINPFSLKFNSKVYLKKRLCVIGFKLPYHFKVESVFKFSKALHFDPSLKVYIL